MHLTLDPALIRRLHARAHADRWAVTFADFSAALEASVVRAFGDRPPSPEKLERYVSALHLEDLALALGCADGRPEAWDHLITTLRPVLYRTADALDPSGGARELADAIWADMYGLPGRSGHRASLLRSFHGRSSLATWLRAVLAQRQVDRFRATRREQPLPDAESAAPLRTRPDPPPPDRAAYVTAMTHALGRALAALPAGDRLRLRCYYAQGLTLAEIGRVTREHESTVSRHLSRTRKAIRRDVERRLAVDAGFDEARIAECFASVAADAGPLDLGELLDDARKKPVPDRSQEEQIP